jgi:DnaJ-class molecular chaperone
MSGNNDASGGAPRPGDETSPDAPQTAQNTCPACGGSGKRDSKPCPDCEGTGLVTVTVGDA